MNLVRMRISLRNLIREYKQDLEMRYKPHYYDYCSQEEQAYGEGVENTLETVIANLELILGEMVKD
jgi:hypothetical protein